MTVTGRFESLRALIEELCRRSGVKLRAYTAQDREVVARYDDVSLRQAFERLLARESFALGFKKSAGDEKARITWIRVVASTDAQETNPRSRTRGAAVFPPVALSDPRSTVRRNATLAFVRRMRADADLRDAILRLSDAALARRLANEPHADEFLAQIESQARSPRIRAKMTRLRARLAAR